MHSTLASQLVSSGLSTQPTNFQFLGNESPPYSPTHLTVDELEEMEVDNISHIRKQPRLSSPGLGGDPSSFNVGRDYSSQAPRADEQRGLEQRLLEQLNAQSKGVTVIMNDDKIKDLTALTLKDLDAFRNQCRQARKNNSLFSRAKHIPPDSRIRAGINFVLRQQSYFRKGSRRLGFMG